MAAAAKVKPVNPHHLTAKQLTADQANLKKARTAAASRSRTAKQKQASRQNLVKARSAQKARRSGKQYVTKKQAQAPANMQVNLGVPDLVTAEIDCNLYLLPACAPVALAEHLAWWTGIRATADQILALHRISSGQLTLDGLLELVMAEGFAGMRLKSFRPCDEGQAVPGLVYGLQVPGGYHAVLGHPAGVVSWGMVLPWPAAPAEAWHLEWRAA